MAIQCILIFWITSLANRANHLASLINGRLVNLLRGSKSSKSRNEYVEESGKSEKSDIETYNNESSEINTDLASRSRKESSKSSKSRISSSKSSGKGTPQIKER
jgi:hypothetical protein